MSDNDVLRLATHIILYHPGMSEKMTEELQQRRISGDCYEMLRTLDLFNPLK